MIKEIVDALPLSETGSADVTREIEKLASPATAFGLVSLLVFGWAATGMMASLRAGLEVAMRVERGRPAVRGKLVDVILIVGAAALVLGVVFLNLARRWSSAGSRGRSTGSGSTAACSGRASAAAFRCL